MREEGQSPHKFKAVGGGIFGAISKAAKIFIN
jgi:hypothetical protein